MRFWDSSCIVPLLVVEASTASLRPLISERRPICAWWGTPVEVTSAMARRLREGAMKHSQFQECCLRLQQLAERWIEVEPNERLRTLAERIVSLHELRAADALQLAAALTVADGEPGQVEFVCLDERLRQAAAREGLRLLPESLEES